MQILLFITILVTFHLVNGSSRNDIGTIAAFPDHLH